ncbi:MAG: nascent polypeptide-associated complex protein [Methanoculleaceae archaeon]
MKQMMKKMGMEMETIDDARRVIIETPRGNYIFDEPEIAIVKMQGISTYQITGEPRFMEPPVEIPEDDVAMVAEQTGAGMDEARQALEECRGDIAEAIVMLTGNGNQDG